MTNGSPHLSGLIAALILIILPACQDTRATSTLTPEDRVGEGFFQYFFSHTDMPGTYFLSQLDNPGLKSAVLRRLNEQFSPAGLVFHNKSDAHRVYTPHSERADSSVILVDPGTGRPGFTLAITSIDWVSGNTADVSFVLASADEAWRSTYTLQWNPRGGAWAVIGFKDLSSIL